MIMRMPRLSPKELAILELLAANGEMYGLQMVARTTELKRGTIYVTLGRMADKGYVESRQVKDTSASGMPRRLFRVTGLGQQVLAAARAASAVMAGSPVHA